MYIKRDDMLHAQVSGNKWRKLLPNIEVALKNGYKGIVSMAGPYSNHLYALAAACNEEQLPCAVYVRGEAPKNMGYTLSYALSKKVECLWCPRDKYRSMRSTNMGYGVDSRFDTYYRVPEGGSNTLGIQGVASLISEMPFEPDYWITALGTGGTAAGLLLSSKAQVVAISVLNAHEAPKLWVQEYLKAENRQAIDRLTLKADCAAGGYAKINQPVVQFMNQIFHTHQILLDPVYTAKALLECFKMIGSGEFPLGSKLVFLHTGGLQGVLGMKDSLLRHGLDPLFFDAILH